MLQQLQILVVRVISDSSHHQPNRVENMNREIIWQRHSGTFSTLAVDESSQVVQTKLSFVLADFSHTFDKVD